MSDSSASSSSSSSGAEELVVRSSSSSRGSTGVSTSSSREEGSSDGGNASHKFPLLAGNAIARRRQKARDRAPELPERPRWKQWVVPFSVEMGGDEEDPSAEGTQQLAIRLFLRPVGFWFAVTFFTMCVVGMILTMTATDYDKDRDYIFRFYETFNPCILFDHWPSNLVTLIMFSIDIVISIAFTLTVWGWAALDATPWTLASSFTAVFAYVLDAAFPNAFAANLYEDHYLEAHEEFGQDQVDKVLAHTVWYAGFLAANMLSMFLFYKTLSRAQGGRLSWPMRISGVLCIFITALGFFKMTLVLVQGQTPFEPDTVLSQILYDVTDTLKTGWYHWVPLFAFRMSAPAEMGLEFRFNLRDGKHGKLKPETFVANSFRLLAGALVGVYLMTDPSSDGVALPITAGFRQLPFRYIFTPLWVTMIFLIIAATTLMVVRRKLLGKPVLLPMIAGFCLVVMFDMALIIMIPQVENTSAIFYVAVVVLAAWLVVSYLNEKRETLIRCVVFTVVFLLLAILSATIPQEVVQTVFSILLIIWLASFQLMMGDQTNVFMTMVQIGHPKLLVDVADQ
jgi:hypothetical protein